MYLDSLIILGWVLLAGSSAGCAYLAYAGWVTRRFAARAQQRPVRSPPVSVLKPLCGEDPELYENLASLCRQDYPAWQIVFGVQDAADAAIAVVRRVMAEFPAAELKLVIEAGRRGGNLKVANLQNMVTAPLLDPAIGLVTCLYRGVPTGGFWSRLAALHINHGFLPQAMVADSLGASGGCFGATLALRRDTLAAIGGLAAIADQLADDHALGAAVRGLGRTVVLSPYLVDNVIAEPSLAALFRHELRWARTIRLVAPAGFLGSIVTHPMALALGALALGTQPIAAPVLLLAALSCRALMVRMVDRALGLAPTPLWLMPGRDLLSFAVFAA